MHPTRAAIWLILLLAATLLLGYAIGSDTDPAAWLSLVLSLTGVTIGCWPSRRA